MSKKRPSLAEWLQSAPKRPSSQERLAEREDEDPDDPDPLPSTAPRSLGRGRGRGIRPTSPTLPPIPPCPLPPAADPRRPGPPPPEPVRPPAPYLTVTAINTSAPLEPSASGRRDQKFRSEWQKTHNWLSPVEGQPFRAKCKLCGTEMRADLSMIKRHENSTNHLNWKKAAATKTSLETFVNRPDTPLNQKVQNAELKLAAFFAAHYVSFQVVDHLIPLLQDSFPDSQICQKVTLGRTKATGLIRNVIAESEKDALTEELKRVKFSILMDESTDIGTTKTACIVVRYYREAEGKIVSRFWDLIQLFSEDDAEGAEAGATAARIFPMVIETFTSRGIPLDNVVGFGSDGCNVMMGEFNSVASRFIEACPGITIMKCICHSLHLCASEACKQLPRTCEDLVRSIYNYFKSSAKRKAMLAQFQKFFDLDVHQVLKPSQTRWLSVVAVVDRVLEQWDALLLFFQDQVLVARLVSAESIFNTMRDPFVKAYLLFLQWVLPKFTGINEFFQSEKTVITVLHEKMCKSYEELLLYYMKSSYIHRRPLQDVDPTAEREFTDLQDLFLGRGVQAQLETPACAARRDLILDFKKRCRTFMMTGCQELKKRYGEGLKALDLLQKVLSLPKSEFCERYDFGAGAMQLLGTLSPAVAVSRTDQRRASSILPLLNALPRCVPDQDMQKIEEEWRMLPTIAKGVAGLQEVIREPDQFWHKLSQACDPCGELLLEALPRFCLAALSLPHSNAECERVFSRVNNTKTKQRNRLITPTICGAMLTQQMVKGGGGCCTTWRPTADTRSRMTSAVIYRDAKKEDNLDDIEFTY